MRGVRADDCLIHSQSNKYGGTWVIYNKEIAPDAIVSGHYLTPFEPCQFVAKLRRIEAEYKAAAERAQAKALQNRDI